MNDLVMPWMNIRVEDPEIFMLEGILNFGIRNPVHNVDDEVAGFAIRKAAFRMQNIDMFKLLCEALLGLS